jgi:hypothetical protein
MGDKPITNSQNEGLSGVTEQCDATLGSISKAMNTAREADEFLGSPVKSFVGNKKADQYIKSQLGQWTSRLYDGENCYAPLLRIEEFWAHLEAYDARFEPSGTFAAQAPWAHLLHGLGINPEGKVVFRKPLGSKATSVRMDVDGEVLCHIFNLFGDYKIPFQCFHTPSPEGDLGICPTPLGVIRWNADPNMANPPFTPGSVEERDNKRSPFGSIGRLIAKDLVATYKEAPDNGVSDPRLAWPDDAEISLPRWIEKLVEHMHKVKGWREPLLLTHKWLEDARRIRCRTTVNNGSEKSFLKDCLRAVDEIPELQQRNTSTITGSISRSAIIIAQLANDLAGFGWESQEVKDDSDSLEVKSMVENGFWFKDKGDRYHYRLNHGRQPFVSHDYNDHIRSWAARAVQQTLESYSRESLGTWKHDLFLAREDVIAVIFQNCEVELDADYIRVLAFDRGGALWNTIVQI